jgi:hypothetical protein
MTIANNVHDSNPTFNVALSTNPIGRYTPGSTEADPPEVTLSGYYPPDWIRFLIEPTNEYIKGIQFSEPGIYQFTTRNDSVVAGTAWQGADWDITDVTVLLASAIDGVTGTNYSSLMEVVLWVARAGAVFLPFWTAGSSPMTGAQIATTLRVLCSLPLTSSGTLDLKAMPYQTCSAVHKKKTIEQLKSNPTFDHTKLVVSDKNPRGYYGKCGKPPSELENMMEAIPEFMDFWRERIRPFEPTFQDGEPGEGKRELTGDVKKPGLIRAETRRVPGVDDGYSNAPAPLRDFMRETGPFAKSGDYVVVEQVSPKHSSRSQTPSGEQPRSRSLPKLVIPGGSVKP